MSALEANGPSVEPVSVVILRVGRSDASQAGAAVATTAFYDNRPTERVTLTLPPLNAARQVLFLVSGPEKAEIVQAVLADVEEHLPARRVRPVAGQITWLLDAAAATRVPSVLPYGLFAAVHERM